MVRYVGYSVYGVVLYPNRDRSYSVGVIYIHPLELLIEIFEHLIRCLVECPNEHSNNEELKEKS